MNLGYIVWLEKLNSVFIQSQVIEVLSKIKDTQINLILFYEWKAFIKENSNNQKIIGRLKKEKIRVIIIPVFLFPKVNWFFYRKMVHPFITAMTFLPLFYYTQKLELDILHFRSYPISHIGYLIKKILKTIKLVFDPRSPFPEECALLRGWPKTSTSYLFWKKQEKQIISKFDCTISISERFKEQMINEHGNIGTITVIPNNVDIQLFSPDEYNKPEIRTHLGIDNDKVLFVYVGSLSSLTWNNPDVYAEFIIKMREIAINQHFLFITNDTNGLYSIFESKGIEGHEYSCFSVSHEEVPYYLSACDFGLNFMSRYDPRLSIKTVEYLSMGLPIFVNKNVTGAAEIVYETGLGYVFENDFRDIHNIKNLLIDYSDISKRSRLYAVKRFSSNTIAQKYNDLYREL